MVYSKDKWIAKHKSVIVAMKAESCPTKGVICAVSTISLILDSLLDDLFGKTVKDELTESDTTSAQDIKDSFLELLKDVQKPKQELLGFAGNASAAAKASGYNTATSALSEFTG